MQPVKNEPKQEGNAKLIKKDEHVKEAFEEAEKDISQDADLSIHGKNDDLDEGELATLGENNNGLV